MKKLLLIALILITNFVSAQTFTKYVDDAQKNGIGFNYNVTFQLTLKRMATKSTVSSAANGTEYSVRLVSVEVDQNSGWNQRGKTYSCSQLNGICNTKTFDRITIDLDYDCEGKELSSNSATFYNIGDVKIMELQPKAVGSNVCASPTVSDIGKVTITEVSVTNTILSIIQKLDQNNSKTTTQNTNTGNQSNTNNSIGQIPDSYTGNPLHYNNPNVSSGSSAVDSYNKGVQQGQQIMDAITPIGNAIVDAYNRKVERENNKILAAREINDERKKDYQIFVQNLNTKISDTNYFYQNVIQKIPNLLSTNSPSWEWLLNSKELPLAFGKNSEYIISTYNDISQTTTKNSRRKDLELEKGNYYTYLYTFGCFTGDDSFKYDYNLNGVNHPYKWGFQGTGIRHESKFIYNEYNIVIGVFLKLLTYYDRYSPSSSFSFEEYYKDLLNKVGANYLLLDANTILLKDKLIIITYDGIEMYDLNLLKDQYFVNFNKYINSPSFKRLGIGFKQLSVKSVPQYENKERKYKSYYTDEKGVIIGSLLTNGLAEKSGLKVDDIISNINGISVTSPYILQLIVQVPTIDNKLKIIYLRNGIEYKTTINI